MIGNLTTVVNEILLPSDAGYVDERFVPQSGQVKHVVALMGNYSSANVGLNSRMCSIIETLVHLHGFNCIFVDGASGQGDLSTKSRMAPSIRDAYCRASRARGFMSAAEFVAATKPHLDFDLWGIDDARRYHRQYAATMRLQRLSPLSSAFLSRLFESVTQIVDKVVPKDTGDFMREALKLSKGSSDIPTKAELNAIADRLALCGVPLPTNVIAWARAGSWPGNLILSLRDLLKGCWAGLAIEYADQPRAMSLLFLLRWLSTAKKAILLNVQPHEVEDIVDLRPEDLGKGGRLEHAAAELGLQMPANAAVLATTLESVREFYKLARERNELMLRNIESQIEERGAERVIVIIAGFHVDHVLNGLRARGDIGIVRIYARLRHLRERWRVPRALMWQSYLGILRWVHRLFAGAASPVEELNRTRLAKALASVASRIQNGRILVLKCNEGPLFPEMCHQLREHVHLEIIAADIFFLHIGGEQIEWRSPSQEVQHFLRANARNVRVLNMMAHFMALATGAFDVVVSDSLELFWRLNDSRKLVAEMARVLRPGGVVGCAIPHGQTYQRLFSEMGFVEDTKNNHGYVSRRGQLLIARKGFAQS